MLIFGYRMNIVVCTESALIQSVRGYTAYDMLITE